MLHIVRFWAPRAPPFTGASITPTPLAAACSPIFLTVAGRTVLWIAIVLPGRAPASTPSPPQHDRFELLVVDHDHFYNIAVGANLARPWIPDRPARV
jgi:hypothetical protein